MPELAVGNKTAGRGWFRSIAHCLGAIRADRAGGVTIFIALSMPAIVGFAGIGTEAANWYLTRRTMQGAADTAASALAAGTSNWSILQSEAKGIAAYYDFVNGSNDTTVTVSPPSSGAYKGSLDAVEVSISKQEPALLSALFLPHGPTISVRAVALANFSLTAEACVVALDKNNETGMTTSGSVSMEFPGCSLYVNSPNSYALNMNGGATIHPNNAYIVGGYTGGGLTTENGIHLGVDPLIDSYRNIAAPAYSGCDSTNYKLVAGKTETKNVGSSGVYVFCGKGIKLEGNSSLALGPGTFIINQGQLNRHSPYAWQV
jgi:Flp pilus assembly protein TadG